MVQEVTNWLQGDRNYLDGVELFRAFGGSSVFLAQFDRGKNAFTEGMLESKLQDMLRKAALVKPEPVKDESALIREVKRLEDEKLRLFKRAAQLHARLKLIATKKERYTTALEILWLMNRNQQIWKMLDFYHENGTLPNFEVKDPVHAMADMIRRQSTLRTYVSRYKDKPQYADRYKRYRQELADLEQKINAV